MRAHSSSRLISASATVPLDAAIDASVIRATRELQHAGWPPARIARVVAELALLREDMGENDAEESSPWH